MFEVDPRAIFFGVVVDQLVTLAVPRFVPAIQLEALAAASAVSTMLGGWVAGRMAARGGWLHGAAVGAVALVIGLSSGVAVNVELPSWYLTSVFLTIVPAGALGGLLAGWRKPFDARTGLV